MKREKLLYHHLRMKRVLPLNYAANCAHIRLIAKRFEMCNGFDSQYRHELFADKIGIASPIVTPGK